MAGMLGEADPGGLGEIAILMPMAISSRLLASGTGWRISDVVCTAGPQDRPYEEQHDSTCMALVAEGTFQYRTARGRAVMVPNSVMLGNAGEPFECGHEHGHGDRCLAFQFSPEYLEPIVASACGAAGQRFRAPRVAPSGALLPIIATAHALRDGRGDGLEFEELGLMLAGAVFQALDVDKAASRAATSRDERRITAALRAIEAEPRRSFSLAELAEEAASSSYHFLRVFRQVVGVTPGQYMLRSRLHRAAVRLRSSDEGVSAIAFDCGFGDLSTFNRHFRRASGVSPGAFRGRRVLRPPKALPGGRAAGGA